MVVDATARLYDVDDDSLVFERLQQKNRYDQGTITFRARKGKLIDLDKLQESIWATRLSGRTSSGLVSLEVSAIGEVVETDDGMILRVSNSDAVFRLGKHTDKQLSGAYGNLRSAKKSRNVRVNGLIDNYSGRWPSVLGRAPANPRRILVTSVTVLE